MPVVSQRSVGIVVSFKEEVEVRVPAASVARDLDLQESDTTEDEASPAGRATETTERGDKVINLSSERGGGVADGQRSKADRLVGQESVDVVADRAGVVLAAGIAEAVVAVSSENANVVGIVGVSDNPSTRTAPSEAFETSLRQRCSIEGEKNGVSVACPATVAERNAEFGERSTNAPFRAIVGLLGGCF